jgi:hypothetical protein
MHGRTRAETRKDLEMEKVAAIFWRQQIATGSARAFDT